MRLFTVFTRYSHLGSIGLGPQVENFLTCDWFKKLLFSTNSLVMLLSDSFLFLVYFI